MSENVVKMQPENIGESYRFDADEILEYAKGNDFKALAILAELPDGSLWVSGNANAGETMILMEKAKHRIVWGDDE